ncbi:hypothetical protein K438DRAFT_1770717 [Mycena galopus ATCC 62051]|nr:hypothetical protein K438DRAFT_1770717 [Mycena galopus ATCC 62051]
MPKTKKYRARTAARPPPAPAAPPFCFMGERKTFLTQYYAQFGTTCDHGAWHGFWREVFKQYWCLSPWRLPLDAEPHCTMDISEPRGEAEFNEMIGVTIATEACIKRHFFHKRYIERRLAVLNTAADDATMSDQPARKQKRSEVFERYKLHVERHHGAFCGERDRPPFHFNRDNALFVSKYDALSPRHAIPSAEEIEKSIN